MNVRLPPVADIGDRCHTSTMATIYMPLLNEGTDVWRPVEATPLTSDTYRVEGEMPDDEEWAFAPGRVVRCEFEVSSSGEQRLTVIGAAD